jgi:hypothetical protein
VKNLIRFCREFGLDYGELEVLRDGENGFLYVLDANNTPTGPSRLLTKKERHDPLSILAETFDKVFLQQVHSDVRSQGSAKSLDKGYRRLRQALVGQWIKSAGRMPTGLGIRTVPFTDG